MPDYKGKCHCGAISFTFTCPPITKGLRCNCSICVRKGAVMSTEAVNKEDIHIQANKEDIGMYQFDTKIAKHYFCKHCGIYTHHETARYPGKFRVNLGCIDTLEPLKLDTDVYDGKNLM